MNFFLKKITISLLILLSYKVSLLAQSISYPTPYTVTSIAGQSPSGFTDGTGTNALFNQPSGIAVDNLGNVYVADQYNYVIRQISASGTVSTIAGQPGISGSTDGIGSAALFGALNGIAIDASGNLYVTDGTYNSVRKISTITRTVTTIVQSTAGLINPLGITVDATNNLYIADSGNYVIRKITPSGNLSIYAGTLGNGAASPGHISYPTGICMDKSNNLYILDGLQSTVCKVTPQGSLSIIGGFPGAPGFLDGALTNQGSQFNHPYAICSDTIGNLYIIDGSSGTLIRTVSTLNIVSTLAGSTLIGNSDGAGGTASFSNAKGIAVDSTGTLYITNTGRNTIRKASPPSINISPSITTNPNNNLATIGASVALSVVATGSGSLTYQWYLNNTAITNNTSISGAQTANLLISNFSANQAGQYYVTITNSFGTVTSTQANVDLPISILTQPQSQSVISGNLITYSVTASGTDPKYQWNFTPNNSAVASPIAGATNSTYTIQNVQQSNLGYYSVTVSNAVSSTTSLAAALTVINPLITTQPTSSTIIIGQSITLSVTASGSALAYQWYFNGLAIPGATSSTYTIASTTLANLGAYKVSVINSFGTVTSNTVQLTGINNPGRLTNLSVLSMDGPGSQLLTIGFVTGGTNTSGAQNLLIRGSGPAISTAPFNVSNVLLDPTLTVYNGSNIIASNDNWGTPSNNAYAVLAADAATGAFALTNTTSTDAALVTSLAPGGYTVQIAGKNGSSGNVIAEVYDDTEANSYTLTTPRLVNLSCLEQIAPGGILSAGFVIGGTTSEQVLIRASGPTLSSAPFNIAGTIPDPKLTVFNSSSSILATNAGWGGNITITAANTATGAFQFNGATSKDSAVLLTLSPGAYTVQATSASLTAGLTLIEVYEVPKN